MRSLPIHSVMAGLVPAIHAFFLFAYSKDVDARHKAGHDEVIAFRSAVSRAV